GGAVGGGRGDGQPQKGARRGAVGAQRSRAAHLRGATARRRPDHVGRAGGRVRRVARARAADRGALLREGAEVGEEARRCDGNSGASAGASACNPSSGGKTADGHVAMSALYGIRITRNGYPLVDQGTEICVISLKIFINAVRKTK